MNENDTTDEPQDGLNIFGLPDLDIDFEDSSSDPCSASAHSSLFTTLTPADQVLRPTEAAEVVAQLLRPHPPVIVVTGKPGSGRTSFLAELAAVASSVAPDLALKLFVMDGDATKVQDRIVDAASVVGKDGVLVIDDFDNLERLQKDTNSRSVAAVSAGASGDGTAFVLVVASQQFDLLASKLNDNGTPYFRMALGDLSEETKVLVIRQVADELVGQFGLGLDDGVIDAVGRPSEPSDLLAQPGLAIDRIDTAIGRARAEGSSTVQVRHLEVPGAYYPSTSVAEIEAELRAGVFGQDEAVATIAKQVAPSLAGLKLQPQRPHAVFLFAGPSGVGKTEMAKQLASVAYGSADALIRLDMSEYAEPQDALAKLIGFFKGFKNSTTEGLLTTKVREKPHAVLLLDEFEKAHKVVWPTFLQVFDEGRLTDGWGNTASFANMIIILTSNMGAREATQRPTGFGAGDGYGSARQLDAIKNIMQPELLGRIDETVVFSPLSRNTIRDVASRELASAAKQFAKTGWHLQYDEKVLDWLADTGYDPASGARHVLHNIQGELLSRLVQNTYRDVRVSVGKDGLEVTPVQPAEPAAATKRSIADIDAPDASI